MLDELVGYLLYYNPYILCSRILKRRPTSSMNPQFTSPTQTGGGLSSEIKALTRQYVQLQAQIDALNGQLTQIRDSKKQIETALISNIKRSGLGSFGITFQGKKIYVGTENTYDTLTFKFLDECLTKLYGANKTQVKQVLDFIKQQRLAKRETSQVIKIGSASGRNLESAGKLKK